MDDQPGDQEHEDAIDWRELVRRKARCFSRTDR
jgi:hypothetical protein